jgi:hypothetical protein
MIANEEPKSSQKIILEILGFFLELRDQSYLGDNAAGVDGYR